MIKHKIILRKKAPQKHQEIVTTQTTTPIYEMYDEERLFAETLNILFDGMANGNQVDKTSAQALIKSIRYKTGKEFYEQCLEAYEEALKLHEAVFVENNMVGKITQNISNALDQGRAIFKKITQQIIFPPNNEARQ